VGLLFLAFIQFHIAVYRHLPLETGWKQKVAGYVIYVATHHQALYQTPASPPHCYLCRN
jgi:hypothetical protein